MAWTLAKKPGLARLSKNVEDKEGSREKWQGNIQNIWLSRYWTYFSEYDLFLVWEGFHQFAYPFNVGRFWAIFCWNFEFTKFQWDNFVTWFRDSDFSPPSWTIRILFVVYMRGGSLWWFRVLAHIFGGGYGTES